MSTNPLNLSETRAGVEGLKIDESLGSLSLGDLGGLNSSLFKRKQEHPKWDGKHLYGTLVVCQKCGRRNVTLYNVGDEKLCKACKGKEVQK